MTHRLRTIVGAGALVALWIAAAATVLAHHGWGEYDSRKPMTLTGTIKTSGYENPHAFIDLEVDGKAWHAVLAPPSRMQARGVAKEQLQTSAVVTVIGFPHKSRAGELKAEQIRVGEKTTYIR